MDDDPPAASSSPLPPELEMTTSPTTPPSPSLDEFQAFVTRVKQLHMSRSADTDCEQSLSHDKARRRRYESAATVAVVDNNSSNPGDSLLKPRQTPPLMAKSLDDQQLQRQGGVMINPTLDDVDMESSSSSPPPKVGDGERVGLKKLREELLVKSVLRGETKDMKKNIQVMVGIDEDLKMILEMDPEIVDLGALEKTTAEPKVMGLPPVSGR